jgi:hypothetical protein
MVIAIDYDNTFTLFKNEIKVFVKELKKNNHTVHLVTARNEEIQKIKDKDIEIFDLIFYTDGKAKASVVRADLWLDDSPVTLCCDFVPGESHAEPSKALHQGYRSTHVLWNWEENRFVSYVKRKIDNTKKVQKRK